MQTPTTTAHGEPERDQRLHSNLKQMKIKQVDFSKMDEVLVNAHSSHGESRLKIFEDNEAVIKMID